MTLSPSRHFGAAKVLLILSTVYTILVRQISSVSAHPSGNTIHVHHGHSIQAAIDRAHTGDRIVVQAGTYAEQLTISKDGIALIGHNVVLVPPSSPTTNTCSGLAGPVEQTTIDTQAGICVTGSDIKLATFSSEHKKVLSVGDPVKGVSITGFSIRGFTGLNIAIVGAQDTCVTQNTLTDGVVYGALTVGSKNSRIADNIVISNPPVPPNTLLGFIAICMDDFGPATVTNNAISGYRIGLCVQTSDANIHDNCVRNCCIGAFVDPGISGANLHDNEVSDTNPACKDKASGSFAVWGIAISGAAKTVVKGNRISGVTAAGRTDRVAAGIAVFDDLFAMTGDLATGNVVEHNDLKHNDVDVLVFNKGTGNVIKDNECKVSVPPGFCP